MSDIPSPRGKLTQNRDLSSLTWLRVGGAADYFFQPSDEDDLCQFMRDLRSDMAVFPIGVGSNLIVRDGGLRAVVVRLGRGFNQIAINGRHLRVGAAALDAHVARKSAEAGLDLTFLRTIPGSIGGAVRMNAGCYGFYVKDHFIEARVVTRQGERLTLGADEMGFAYRQSSLPPDWIITEALFAAETGDPDALAARMATQLAKRDETQPTKELSAGSTSADQ